MWNKCGMEVDGGAEIYEEFVMEYSSTSLIRPPFIRISLLSGRDLAVIFFLCVYNNYGEKGDFKLNQNSYTNSHELHIIPNIINIHSHQIFF